MPMQLITVRDRIKGVSKAWREQYYKPCEQTWITLFEGSSDLVYAKLCGLDTDTCTAQDVAAIIGNKTWTMLACHNCGKEVEAVVQLGQPMDYDSSAAQVCVECLNQALELIANGKEIL